MALSAYLMRRPRAGRPQVVQGSFLDEGGYTATAIGRVLGVPSVAVAHGTDVRVARGQVPGGVGRRRRARLAMTRADRVIAVSHQLAQELALLGVRAEVMPFTSDADRFVLAPAPADPPEVLFVGRVGRGKGVDRLLEAFVHVSAPAILRLVGPDAGDLDVPAMVAQLGLSGRVEIDGEVPQDALPARYARAAILALPSRGEGLPCVIIESLLTGRPVVATAVGGVAEVVDDRVGALLADASPRALAQAIEAVLARRFDGAALRERALPYTWQATGPMLIEQTRALLAMNR